MPGVIEKTDELIDAIQQSKEYIIYNELKQQIAHESGIKMRVDSFRGRLFMLQSCGDTRRDDFEMLRTEYKDILENSRVMEFLSAEQSLIEMFRTIYQRLSEAVTFDLKFPGEMKELNI